MIVPDEKAEGEAKTRREPLRSHVGTPQEFVLVVLSLVAMGERSEGGEGGGGYVCA